MIVFIVIILAMIGVFSLRLYKTQAVVTEESLVAADADSMTYQSTVEAARGNILDRNGNVLVSNRASYNLVIVNFVFFNAPDPNGNLLKVLDLCDELGIQYESHFPVTPDRPYEYTDDNNSAWQENFRKFLADRGYDLDISAPTLMKRLRSEYKIPDDWKQADVYRIIAVRYELELRSIEGVGLENYTLAEDVDAESLAAVMELAVPGVVVENGTVREYNTKYAAHILGYIGPIWSAEADEYREKGYSMNALVGKSGVEQAFEQYLHGSSGLKKTTVSSTGEILSCRSISPCRPWPSSRSRRSSSTCAKTASAGTRRARTPGAARLSCSCVRRVRSSPWRATRPMTFLRSIRTMKPSAKTK